MITDPVMAAAQRMPLRSVDESRMASENQTNAGGARKLDDNGKPYYDPAPRSDYPRMMYKQTDVEQTQDGADVLGMKDERTVINRFGGLLCDICIAHSATEAEALSELGWDISPQAAYGQVEGMVSETSAKDDEIAALRAELARRDQREAELIPSTTPSGQRIDEPARRGPGRPPKAADTA